MFAKVKWEKVMSRGTHFVRNVVAPSSLLSKWFVLVLGRRAWGRGVYGTHCKWSDPGAYVCTAHARQPDHPPSIRRTRCVQNATI